MKKIFILLIVSLLLTGCTVTYNLDINTDQKISEEINFYEDNSYLSTYGEKTNEVVNSIIDFYFSGENNIEPQIVIKNRKVVDKNIGKTTNYSLKKEISNIETYEKTLFFKYYFNSSKITSNNNNYTIYATVFNWDNVKELTTSYKYKFDLNEITIKIHSDMEVLESNATNIDYNSNTYYWKITEENASTFELKLTYSKKEKFAPKTEEKTNIIDSITGSIIETISGGSIDGSQYVKKNKTSVIIIFGLVLTIIVSLILIIRKKINKANNI